MRLIPVIDLLDGQAVHAVRGNRAGYQPLKSVLCNNPDPLELARSYRDRMRFSEIYVADLNSICGPNHTRNRKQIESLIRIEGVNIILDAGVSSASEASILLRSGISKTVVGAETISTLSALLEIPANVESRNLIFSLDMRSGKVLSRCCDLAAMSPMDALGYVHSAGWKEIILLDLMRVGSGEGVDRALVAGARTRFPELNLLVGGGIANLGQLLELKLLGIAGALVGTALHNGAIADQHLSTL